MKQISTSFVAIVIGIVVLGFLAGVVGELWLNSFLLPDPYLNFKNYSDLTKRINDLVSGQSSTPSGYSGAVSNAAKNVLPAMARIYRNKKFATSAGGLLPSDLLGQGLVITSDGWIVTTSRAVSSSAVSLYAIALNERSPLPVQKIVFDAVSGLVFIKIDASNLSVAEFILKNNLTSAEPVYLFDNQNGLVVDYVENNNYGRINVDADLLHTSEKFYKFIQLQNSLSNNLLGGPLITANGRVAGVLTASDLAIPVDYMTSLMKAIVKGEKWTRPYLGLKFYDLTEISNPNVSDYRGALIAKAGVAFDSPAKGIILPDDIIVKVESDDLGVKKNLSELISQYQPGNTLKFTLKRQGTEMTVDVKLK
ncbi:MAG: S1C family serine protease [Parcubacteria group bacterium]